MPWPLSVSRKDTQKRYQGPDNANIRGITQGGRGRDTEARRDLRRTNPPGDDRDMGTGRGRQWGERTSTGNGGRRRHAEQGAGTSNIGWRMAGTGSTQVRGASNQERRWGAGETRGLRR